MILRAKWWVDRQLCLHENATLDTGGTPTELDLQDSILMPGLVNAHCHLDYTAMKGRLPASGGFADWIKTMVELKRSWSQEDFTRSIDQGAREALEYGTTSMGNWICSAGAFAHASLSPMRILWFLEQIDFGSPADSSSWKNWPPSVHGRQSHWQGALAPHSPYTCRPETIAQISTWSGTQNLPWSIHVAESQQEFDMLLHAKGPLYELMQNAGRDMQDCGRSTPLGSLEETLTTASSPVLLVHLNLLHRNDTKTIKFATAQPLEAHTAPRAKLNVVHCPRSHRFFQHPEFPLETLGSLHLNICLGTDSLASNENLSMFEEMGAASESHAIPSKTLLQMATVNGAKALGWFPAWETWQDWIAIPATDSDASSVWKNITGFTGKPHFVMVDGQVCLRS